MTKNNYFRVRGNSSGSDDDVRGVYVLGDIVARSANSLMELDYMVPVVCSSVAVDIAGADTSPSSFG